MSDWTKIESYLGGATRLALAGQVEDRLPVQRLLPSTKLSSDFSKFLTWRWRRD